MALLDIRGIEMRRSDRLRLDARTKYTRLAFKLDPLSKPTNDAKLERTVDGEIVAGTAAESERVDRVGITKTDLAATATASIDCQATFSNGGLGTTGCIPSATGGTAADSATDASSYEVVKIGGPGRSGEAAGTFLDVPNGLVDDPAFHAELKKLSAARKAADAAADVAAGAAKAAADKPHGESCVAEEGSGTFPHSVASSWGHAVISDEWVYRFAELGLY